MPTDSRRKFILVGASAASIVFLVVLAAVCYFVQTDPSDGHQVAISKRASIDPRPKTEDMLLREAGPSLWQSKQASEFDGSGRSAPKNVILMIGDGMGLGQVSTASSLLHGTAGGLALEDAQVVGLIRVWTLDDLVVDSAAAGTAIATGFRTNKKMVGIVPDGRPVRNLLEAARGQGMATAIITTSYLMDATPACFSAHAANRNQYTDILDQMLDSGTDILLGGSSKIPVDGEEGLASQIERASELGFTVVRDEEELAAATGNVLGLFPSRNGDPSFHGPPLELSTRKMLDLLADRPGGFAAVIETEITDEAGHSNDVKALVEGVREFDHATRVVLDFAERRGDTLVLVLADHSTGVPAIVDGKHGATEAGVQWLTGSHTGHWLPIFAFGPGSKSFSGVFDQAQIGPTIAALMGFEDYPAVVSDRYLD